MLTEMEGVSRLVEAVKGGSGCSVRDLAERADVAASTITRIQRGAVDPTVGTLARILDAAGYDLELNANRRSEHTPPRLGHLAAAWSHHRGRIRPDWNRWRALIDTLAIEPDRIPEAIYVPPPPAGHPVIDNLLAAVAERLADSAGLRRPSWTAAIPPLAQPWQPPSRSDREEVPDQFTARGLIIDAASLWRDPATVGV
jgi:transcriptional regulator with XRE-family HTH domain